MSRVKTKNNITEMKLNRHLKDWKQILKGSWKPYWQELFQSLKNIVPQEYLVIVSADRGLYADWLYQKIIELGWHPFLRINHQGQYRDSSSDFWQPLAKVITKQNQHWSGRITCFKINPIDCTLLARWDDDYADPWLVLTDLESTNSDVIPNPITKIYFSTESINLAQKLLPSALCLLPYLFFKYRI